MLKEIGPAPYLGAKFTQPTRLTALARKFSGRKFRATYMSRHLRVFLATQIRALRGNDSQAEFGKKLGKPQSVISRYENEDSGNLNVSTLIEIAQKLDIAIMIRFVDFPTFLKQSDDDTQAAYVPEPYRQEAIEVLIANEERQTATDALQAWSAQLVAEQQQPLRLISRRTEPLQQGTTFNPTVMVGFEPRPQAIQ